MYNNSLEALFNSPVLGYAHHRMILDDEGTPVDYEFLEVNTAFEKLIGIPKEELENRTVREVLPGIEKDEFDWIGYYAEVALGGVEKHIEQFSSALQKWYLVHAYSTRYMYFSVLCLDITSDYLIGEASKKFNEYHSGNVDYAYIARQMQLITGAKYVALNVFDANGDFATAGLAGVNRHLQKASSLLGFPISGKKWRRDPVRDAKIKDQKTTFFKNLRAVTGDVISSSVVSALEKMGSTGAVVVIKTTKDNVSLGDFTLILEKGAGLKNQRAAETFADVTGLLIDRINTEKKVRENKEQFESLVANLPGIAFRRKNDADGTMLYLTNNVHSISGYEPDELLHNCSVSYRRLIVSEDREMVSDHIASSIKENKPWEIEYRIRHKDGRIRWMYEKGRAVSDAGGRVVFQDGLILDISGKKQAEEALDQERTLLRTIIDSIPDSIFVKDTETRKQIANKAELQKTGFEREEDLVGKNDFDIWPSEIAEPFFEDDQKILKHGERVVNREEKLIMPDGSVMWQLVTKLPLHDQTGNITGLVGIGRDITGRKLAEEEIKKQLQEKQVILKETNHRIKNNFATVEGLLHMQAQSVEHPETQSALEGAVSRVQSMRVLYEQLLASDEQKELSVKQYIENLADSIVASLFDSDRITLDKQIADFQLASNRMFHIGIIINELLTNAMKYAFNGKASGQLWVTVEEENRNVTINVRDNGSGLPDGFDAGASQGFGLMLVSMISEQLGGSFTIRNDNGTRCTVAFKI